MKRYEKSLPVIGFGIDRDQIDAFSVSQSKHQSEKQIAIYVVGVGGVFFVYVFIRFENSGERKVNTHLERKKKTGMWWETVRERLKGMVIKRNGTRECKKFNAVSCLWHSYIFPLPLNPDTSRICCENTVFRSQLPSKSQVRPRLKDYHIYLMSIANVEIEKEREKKNPILFCCSHFYHFATNTQRQWQSFEWQYWT